MTDAQEEVADGSAPDGAYPGSGQDGGVWTTRWHPALPLVAGVCLAVALLTVGLIASRADIACLGLPFVVGAALAWRRSPGDQARLGMSARVTAEQPSTRTVTVILDPPAGAEFVQLRYASALTRITYATLDARAAELRATLPVLHSGPQALLRVDARSLGPAASFVSESAESLRVTRITPPPFTPIANLPLPRRLQGMTGAHESARMGDGGDFRDIHPFQPGDRLRRIDWKATARLGRDGELFVRRTAATSDAVAFIVLDSAIDVGENVVTWSSVGLEETGTTSLDIARSAASAIAAGYVRVGDRVAFHDLGMHRTALPPGSGTRHLDRMLRTIARAEPRGRSFSRLRPPIIPSGALVYLLSTLLDDEVFELATRIRAAGHRLIAVDTLPRANASGLSTEQQVAHRIVVMERVDRIERLTAAGVELLPWATDDAERAARLRALSRPRHGGAR